VVVRLCTDLDPALPRLPGIESEVRQALVNLIINAVDAMPRGGTVTLRSRRLSPVREQPWVCLEVCDTGIGMDEETRGRCLEPFYSTKGLRGTGLGLAMVYGVMERHQGRIEIESAPGVGTTIRLVFPVQAPPPASMAAPLADAVAQMPPLRILCIDDEPTALEVVGRVLSGLGHTVVARESGDAGLESFRQAQLQEQPFDTVITDLGMPAMDGLAVAQAIKRAAPQTPVILLTGWGMFMSLPTDRPPEVDLILSKPTSSDDLVTSLHKVIRQPAGMVVARG
jgi:CheY-like chemotaxis protein